MDVICESESYTCGEDDVYTSIQGSSNGIAQTETRKVFFVGGGISQVTQERKRQFNYVDSNLHLYNVSKFVQLEEQRVKCVVENIVFTHDFKDYYDTLDTTILYVDLRYNVIVTKEVVNKVVADKTTGRTPPSNSVSVFSGMASTELHPVMFDTIPIEESTEYNLYINGAKTNIATTSAHRGEPDVYLLMPAFTPLSTFGYTLSPAWANEYDWYNNRLEEPLDGDQTLFWAKWHRRAGLLDQALDSFNRDLLYNQSRVVGNKDVESSIGYNPRIGESSLFTGSVAFDRDKNCFISIACGGNLLNKLTTASGEQVSLPTEKVYLTSSPKTLTEVEHTTWYPIAPV